MEQPRVKVDAHAVYRGLLLIHGCKVFGDTSRNVYEVQVHVLFIVSPPATPGPSNYYHKNIQLNFQIMKKYLFVIALMLTISINVIAQTAVATLSHEGAYRAFYGANAFMEAQAAAVSGDIITLSSGSFSITEINKAITIRGAGIFPDTVRNTFPTYIAGNTKINISDTTNRLIIEGVKFTSYTDVANHKLIRPSFIKCSFNSFSGTSSSNKAVENGQFINCIFFGEFYSGSTVTFVNSYINCNYLFSCYNPRFEMQNCVIRAYGPTNSSKALSGINSSSFENCIIIGCGEYVGTLNSSNYCRNCIATGTAQNALKNVQGDNNKVVDDVTALFKEFTGSNYYAGISFEMTDEAAATYLGTDGTQVGMYGGLLPFNPTPCSLQITKCDVSKKSTADGKLSVDIEVRTVE